MRMRKMKDLVTGKLKKREKYLTMRKKRKMRRKIRCEDPNSLRSALEGR